MGDLEFVVWAGPERGAVYPISSGHLAIGSSASCDLRFKESEVQPQHAEVDVDAHGRVWVKDVTGHGLLWLNGQSIDRALLEPGIALRIGQVELRVRRSLAAQTPILLNQALADDAMAARPTLVASNLDAMQVSPNDLQPGQVIDGRYQIVRKVAIGGMGEVYRTEHVELSKPMALKVMLPVLSSDTEFVSRFKREAVAASHIGQQNIVDISDFGRTADGRFYYVMEYLDGVSLSTLMREEGAQPVERVVDMAVQIARALAAAHAQGIIHRDLKPDNVMLLQRCGQPDFVKVLDFGIAKVLQGQVIGGETAVGLVVGTPQYMSPEQAKAVAVDHRSDIYSMGLILYELLTGRPTFTAETPSMLMVKHVTELPAPFEPGPLSEVPPELQQLVFAMLAKSPDERPQSMDAVLAGLLGKSPGLKKARSTSRTKVLLGVAGVLLAGVFLMAWPRNEVAPVAQPIVAAPSVSAPVPVTALPAKEPVRVRLIFSGKPATISVFEGDVWLGVTPLSIVRDAASVAELTFSAKGYLPLTYKVRFDSEQRIPIELEPKPKPRPAVTEEPSLPKIFKKSPYE